MFTLFDRDSERIASSLNADGPLNAQQDTEISARVTAPRIAIWDVVKDAKRLFKFELPALITGDA